MRLLGATKAVRRRRAINILLQLVAMIAIGMLVYPQAANWISRIGQNSQISGYIEQVGTAEKVSVQRDGLLYSYADVSSDA